MQVHPRVAAILIGGGGKPLRELEEETGKLFHFQGTDGIPLDTFEILAEGTREEIEDRALPFKQGEEVLIRIEEPHMYNVDDAIAKIDGYVISISGGGPFVGREQADQDRRGAAHRGVREHRDQQWGARVRSATTSRPTPWMATSPSGSRFLRRTRRMRSSEAAEEGGEQKVQSNGSTGRRRRGRRGGRRRSRAGAATAAQAR